MHFGVGDTVNSSVTEINGKLELKRGGSDRAFLQLIQDIHPNNIVVYIDSSGGKVKNRKPVLVETTSTGEKQVVDLPTDPDDPLTLNMTFPNGHTTNSNILIHHWAFKKLNTPKKRIGSNCASGVTN